MAAHYFKTKTLAHTLRALDEIERMKEEQRNEREQHYLEEMALNTDLEAENEAEAQYQAVESKAGGGSNKKSKEAAEYDSVSEPSVGIVSLN